MSGESRVVTKARVDKKIIWRDFGYENNYDGVGHVEDFEEIGPFAFDALDM